MYFRCISEGLPVDINANKKEQIEDSKQKKNPVIIGYNEVLRWWARSDLNRGPRDYESPALTN